MNTNIDEDTLILYGDEMLVVSAPFKGSRGSVVEPNYHGLVLLHLNAGRVVDPGGTFLDMKKGYVDHRFAFERDDLHRESRSIFHDMTPEQRQNYFNE